MIIDEGYIKYECIWEKEAISIPDELLAELNKARNRLVDLNMMGKIPNGPGFGNISIRELENNFIISATNTGHLNELQSKDLSVVHKVDVSKNKVWCKGLSQASSESMTHAAIYNKMQNVGAIIHIHHKPMWESLLNKHTTTPAKIAYGTPEMAEAVGEASVLLPENQLLILGGHEDGIISFGDSLTSAFERIEQAFNLL